jgi:hypothetical protein
LRSSFGTTSVALRTVAGNHSVEKWYRSVRAVDPASRATFVVGPPPVHVTRMVSGPAGWASTVEIVSGCESVVVAGSTALVPVVPSAVTCTK